MTSDQTSSHLKKIVGLSGSMLTTAREGDWERVREIEQQRQKLLDEVFPLESDNIANPATLTQQIQQIVDFDKQTMALMERGRKELAGLQNKISSGRQAVSAYQDIQNR
jgi:hypothetical protein